MPPVSRTISVSQNFLTHSYFQRPVKSERAGIDHTEEDQPFWLNFEEIYFERALRAAMAMALCPSEQDKPHHTGEDFLSTFWCSEKLETPFHK